MKADFSDENCFLKLIAKHIIICIFNSHYDHTIRYSDIKTGIIQSLRIQALSKEALNTSTL